ncbi:MAG: acetate--CoA ligase alpha subunit [Acidobacteriota bacterium]
MNKKGDLQAIFSPGSVAVIGASSREGSVGRAIFSNILLSGYTGIVYPVNPKARGVLGVRAYHAVWDIPGEVDLAIIITPSQATPLVLEECGEKGVRGAVIITAGFKEIGEKGFELEKKVKEIANKYGIAVVGPNCLGVINTDPDVKLNATFARGMPKQGNIAFISQSGALGVAALEYAHLENIGLSKFVSVGNKADVTENDLLASLANDPLTDVILLYVEDLADPRMFVYLARNITGEGKKAKPILAIKSGRTVEGAKAASSHTGALASSDEAYDSFFFQCGVLRVETLEDIFDYAKALANQPLPKGERIAIVTNAGGPGIMATDASIRHGLKLANFGEVTTKKLREGLPPTANVKNPVDVIGDADHERYKLALETVLADSNVDGLIVISTPQMMTNLKAVATTISETTAKYDKPVLACFMATEDISETVKIFDNSRIPHYLFPEAAARAMAAMSRYAHWLHRQRTEVKIFRDIDQKTVEGIIAKAKGEKRTFLPEPESHAILKAYGFPVLKSRLVRSVRECVDAAKELGYPVVLKIVSPDIIHKFDFGGVKVGIKNEESLKEAYDEIISNVKRHKPDANIWGIFVQEFALGGKETIIGMNRDPHFGPLIMFGLGGVYVEVLKDVTFRLAPIRELGSRRMVEEIRGYKILKGFRGEKPSDIAAIAECIQRLSQLSIDFSDIRELDINPLIVYEEGKGARVVDARITIEE